jgi:hypothetical protein
MYAVRLDDALGNAVIIPQIDEQQASMVPLSVHPAGNSGCLPHIRGTKGATGMATINMHVDDPWNGLLRMPSTALAFYFGRRR